MENLITVQGMALLEEGESDVVALVFRILGNAKKEYRNGYYVTSESYSVNGKAHVTVQVVRDNQYRMLVIKCIKGVSEIKRGRISLIGYMSEYDYPNGMLICGQYSEFYTLDTKDKNAVPVGGSAFNNSTQISLVVETVARM
ncbi:hypothetical protein AX774_g4 [Zancudomyces culisetae]|uniref:Uncharacterized protein n=1 Tax=Zancudomyces culisetae TaxID=1213189 RepID=A0A1R1PZN6_ZANCU|nr:hypothetical protein AX774_g4 [Zancudomyces culisetae]|eukprot:OMH86416.1 hypothetical protein AX774_g4 [Zancudomyces culisetae]